MSGFERASDEDEDLAPIPRLDGFDEIDRPRHYNSGRIECWDYIVDQDMGYLDGCVVKYVTRFRIKGTPLKDLRKARAYLDRLIKQVEAEQ